MALLPAEVLLPLIIRLFPTLVRTPLLGKIIPLFKIDPASDEALARALNRNFKRKKKRGFNDNAHVVKLDEAIKCVEQVIGDGKLQAAGLLRLSKMLLDQKTGGSEIGDAIISCMREKILQQGNQRAVGKFVKTKGTGLPGPEGQETYTEIIKLRRGDLHPTLPTGKEQ
jgi:hypothetical protein